MWFLFHFSMWSYGDRGIKKVIFLAEIKYILAWAIFTTNIATLACSIARDSYFTVKVVKIIICYYQVFIVFYHYSNIGTF